MNKINSDRFEINNNKFNNHAPDNFFMLDDDLFAIDKSSIKNQESGRRLNDYDFNLLKEDAYKDVSDDLFKLEYKIAKTEEDIKNLESQLQAAADINDYYLIQDLKRRIDILKEDQEALVALYNNKSMSARITDSISNLLGENVKQRFNIIKQQLESFSSNILEKMPKQFSTIIELKKSLNKLENINRSVDELVSMNIPYGENINKYEQLSKYIIKANSLQAEISKNIKR